MSKGPREVASPDRAHLPARAPRGKLRPEVGGRDPGVGTREAIAGPHWEVACRVSRQDGLWPRPWPGLRWSWRIPAGDGGTGRGGNFGSPAPPPALSGPARSGYGGGKRSRGEGQKGVPRPLLRRRAPGQGGGERGQEWRRLCLLTHLKHTPLLGEEAQAGVGRLFAQSQVEKPEGASEPGP